LSFFEPFGDAAIAIGEELAGDLGESLVGNGFGGGCAAEETTRDLLIVEVDGDRLQKKRAE
jgi:hypothetical protein